MLVQILESMLMMVLHQNKWEHCKPISILYSETLLFQSSELAIAANQHMHVH